MHRTSLKTFSLNIMLNPLPHNLFNLNNLGCELTVCIATYVIYYIVNQMIISIKLWL